MRVFRDFLCINCIAWMEILVSKSDFCIKISTIKAILKCHKKGQLSRFLPKLLIEHFVNGEAYISEGNICEGRIREGERGP